VSAVSRRIEQFGTATIAVVFFDLGPGLSEYRTHVGVDDRIVLAADPDLIAARAFDVGRGRALRVWGPSTFLAYARLMMKGRAVHRHNADSLRLGADFVLAPDGRIAAAYRPDRPDDRPAVDELVSAVRSLTEPEGRP
jgi:hypothetical protein